MSLTRPAERYGLEASPFYRMGTAADLAAVLGISQKKLRELIVKSPALYNIRDEEIDGKMRRLAVPVDEMRALHERLKDLFGRIILPDYLFSPRKGRSTVTNALLHLGARHVVKLDVKKFYPSTTDEHVFQFFRHRLGMDHDVAGRLRMLCTVEGTVATGSPVSPILCALVHNDMFARIAERCEAAGVKLSLWVDDLTISGQNIPPSLMRDIERLIESKRMFPHKAKRTNGRRSIVITGTRIGPDGAAPANKSHMKMAEKKKALEMEKDPSIRLTHVTSLIGMARHHMTIYPKGSEKYEHRRRMLQWLWNIHRRCEAEIASAAAAKSVAARAAAAGSGDMSVPWN